MSVYRVEDGAWGDPGYVALRERTGREVGALYVHDDLSRQRVAPLAADDVVGVVLVRHEGEVVAGGVLSVAHGPHEVARLAVHPAHRRRGLAGLVLAGLEDRARAAGVRRLALQTGFRQEGAVALYRSRGWRETPPYGPYRDDVVVSVCFEKEIVP